MELTEVESAADLPAVVEALRAVLSLTLEALPVASVAERLQEAADLALEHELQGVGEALALITELVSLEETQDRLSSQQSASLTQALSALLQPQRESEKRSESFRQAVQDPGWSEPLADEDLELLPGLLSEDWARIDGLFDQQSDDARQSGAESETEADDDAIAAVAESLLERSETLAEQDQQALADLFALSAEAIEGSGSLSAEPVPALLAALDALEQPSLDTALQVLDLLALSDWEQPLDGDDVADLRELLAEYFARDESALDESLDTEPEPELEPEPDQQSEPELVVQSAEVLAERASAEDLSFCAVDMALLEQPGPRIDAAILAMLAGSLQALEDQWQTAVGDDAAAQLIEDGLDALAPLARASSTVNLTGVELLLKGLVVNLRALNAHPERFFSYTRQHIARTLQALHRHLDDLSDRGAREALVDCLSDEALPVPADIQQAGYISGLLALAGIQAADEIELQTARPEDADLAIGEGVDEQLLEMLYTELPHLVEEFQQQLQSVIQQRLASSLLAAQRAAHTIKGLANMAGIRGVANLTHHLEDILEQLTDAGLFPGEQLAEDLNDAADCLAMMSEAVTEGGVPPEAAQTQLQQLMNWFYRLRTEGVECAGQALSDEERARRREQAESAAAEAGPEAPVAAPAAVPETKESNQIRVPVTILDNLFRIAGEASTLGTQLDATLTQMRALSRSNRERQRLLQRVLFELEQQLQDHFTLTPALQQGESDFDPLEMDRYHAMHTTLSQLQEAVADVREVDLESERQLRQLSELQVAQGQLQKESLENVLGTRLVPARTLASRMQRIMRQACRAADKQGQLVIEGEEVMVDSQILNQLADPLMHMIRNAVDHGLETPHLRFEAGKPETGTLTIRFVQAEGVVQVLCEDDGAGIDLQRVREIAERRGLVEPEAMLSDAETQRLILVPGFSTREEISQLSGRGIGMDVVYQQVSRMRGTLNIHSQQGQGTRFELSMPSSSLLLHTLLVKSAGQRIFALSSHSIEQTLLSLDGQCRQRDEGVFFELGGVEYPAFTLEGLAGERAPDYSQMRVHPVLLVNLDQGDKAVVFVREILAHRELVFKRLGDQVPDIPGIPGLTILANGEVAPIIDLQARVRHCHSQLNHELEQGEADHVAGLPRLLVVDDSLSARRTLATLLSDSGYEVETAIDGLDALDKVRRNPPDLVVTDLEMPRMNGIELTAMLRNSQDFGAIPVVMITSRSTSKHRDEAAAAGVSDYLIKPWTESGVLELVERLLF